MSYVIPILALSALCVAWVFVQRLCAGEDAELPCGSCSAHERGCIPADAPRDGERARCNIHSEELHGGPHEQH